MLKKLWDGGSVSFRGSIYRLENVDVGFTPARRGGPKIIIACGAFIPRDADTGPNDIYSPRIAGKFLAPLDRVARLGDGWITGMTKPEEWRDLWDRLRSEGERLGRDLDSPDFERRLNCFLHVGPDAEARREGREFLERYHRRPMDQETLDRWLFAGPAGYCAEQIGRFVEVGVNSFQLVLASAKQKEQLERLVEDVLPFVRTGVSASDSSQPGRRRGERLPAPGGEVMSHGSFRR